MKHTHSSGRFLATFAFAVLLAFYPGVSSASTGLSIQPVKVSETMNPGQTITGYIQLTNASDGPVDVEVNTQDFIPVGGADSIQFVGRAEGVTSVKDWITVDSTKTFAFQVGETREIPYTVTAPANAEPGGHFGVVFFKATPHTEDVGALKVGTQVGMLVLISIPGNHLQKGQIISFTAPQFIQSGPVPFDIAFQNTGTVHFEPKGTIVISNMFGQKVADVPIEGQVVLPTSIKTLKESWNVSGLLIGQYKAKATLVDGEGEILTTQTISFWAFPIWYVVSFFVCLVVLFFVFRFLKSRVRISIVSN